MKLPLIYAAAVSSLSLLPAIRAGSYSINQTNIGSNFLTNFEWEDIADPTKGRVHYVNQSTALANNLTFTSDDTFIMRADYTTNLTASGSGRMSNRIKSYAQYRTHVAVFDIRHMPQGCGTWPAVWEADDQVGTSSGEIDILEGVNDIAPNSVTLHTTGSCTMPENRAQLGSSDTISDGNNGCSVDAPYTASYGKVFNTYGGGYYAMERTAEYIRVWFWSRNDSSIPSDITSGASAVDTDNWGKPIALFPNTDCDIGSAFQRNNIIINLTFCGSWAGNSFSNNGCPGNCTEYVNYNPSAFEDAYWDIAAVRIYQPSSNSSEGRLETVSSVFFTVVAGTGWLFL
ncbi:putative beta-glucanase from glycoside hydrolase family GH16 [Fomitopsis serialis]|uniref:putative beta-glucanase from glycoside hydrolase family GH16 n=1 Tax=Fomitopsis serialis TaxID=139415 RepID=UPI002007FC23|nr:putative beta-glucanase from glycoside hydrolase family GH16 [Neoantrodia serialis]KAH9920472.1 putative beta-glucanase from glycoside hydrolase family GH16 [Neoantrodia serialis]